MQACIIKATLYIYMWYAGVHHQGDTIYMCVVCRRASSRRHYTYVVCRRVSSRRHCIYVVWRRVSSRRHCVNPKPSFEHMYEAGIDVPLSPHRQRPPAPHIPHPPATVHQHVVRRVRVRVRPGVASPSPPCAGGRKSIGLPDKTIRQGSSTGPAPPRTTRRASRRRNLASCLHRRLSRRQRRHRR